jgi:thioredoxin 2
MTAPNMVVCARCGRKNRVPAAAEGNQHCGNCGAPLPWIADATDDDFSEIADSAAVPVVVDLWATWCAPCRMVSPALEQVATEMAGRLKLVKVDVDRAPALSERFAARARADTLLMNHGQVISRRAGAAPAPAIRKWVEAAVAGGGSKK